MALSEPSRLVEFVRQSAGDSLRVVASYDATDLVVHVANEERASNTRELREEVDQWITECREASGPEIDRHLGRSVAQIELREQAVVITFATGPKEGVLVSLGTEAGRDLATFVKNCLVRIPEARDHPLPEV